MKHVQLPLDSSNDIPKPLTPEAQAETALYVEIMPLNLIDESEYMFVALEVNCNSPKVGAASNNQITEFEVEPLAPEPPTNEIANQVKELRDRHKKILENVDTFFSEWLTNIVKRKVINGANAFYCIDKSCNHSKVLGPHIDHSS